MANFYWYGGTGNWSDYTNHWSLNSGNSPANPAANVPTSSDDVFIDANSGFGGGGTITLDGFPGTYCQSFTSTSGDNYLITNSGSSINCYGSMTLESGITLSNIFTISFRDNTGTLTANNVDLGNVHFSSGTNWTISGDTNFNSLTTESISNLMLNGDVVITGEFYQENGTFDANGHNVTANDFYFYADTGYTPTIYMGSGTWTANGNFGNLWTVDETSPNLVTFNPETSTIKLVGTSGGSFTFNRFSNIGKTYNNIWFTTSGHCAFTILGDNTFNDIKFDVSNDAFVNSFVFGNGSTTILNTFTVSGKNGNLTSLNSQDGVTQFTLSKSSGIVSCDYLNISNSNATGGAEWDAGRHSTNTTNNTGWRFGRRNFAI